MDVRDGTGAGYPRDVSSMTISSHAALDLDGRWPKAEKIRRLLRLEMPIGDPLRILEVGTGSGAIAHYFSQLDRTRIRVCAVDVADQRQICDGYHFLLYDGCQLPFDDGRFDLVISNHVVEHIRGTERQLAHIGELSRMLRPAGRIFMATPSRWQPVEPHFRLPLLSWLPRALRDGYVRRTGRGVAYDCDPLSHTGIERLFQRSGLRYTNLNVAAFRAARAIEPRGGSLLALADRIPDLVLQRLYRLSPTMVYLLEPCQ